VRVRVRVRMRVRVPCVRVRVRVCVHVRVRVRVRVQSVDSLHGRFVFGSRPLQRVACMTVATLQFQNCFEEPRRS